jgi:hypothetical protein
MFDDGTLFTPIPLSSSCARTVRSRPALSSPAASPKSPLSLPVTDCEPEEHRTSPPECSSRHHPVNRALSVRSTWKIYLGNNPAVAAAVQRIDLALADRSLTYLSPSFLTASHSVPKRYVASSVRRRAWRGRSFPVRTLFHRASLMALVERTVHQPLLGA